MRKIILAATTILLAIALIYPEQVGLPEGVQKIARRAGLPFKLALLYAKEPDGELLMPVSGARVGQVANTWHAARSGERLHEGQDIFARRGTAVYSATEGYIVRIGENSLGGKTVFVLGAGGRSYYYAHLDAYAPELAVGDRVSPETVLGYVGTTGNAAGTLPHLHFGVYTNAGALNPLPLLRDREQQPHNTQPSVTQGRGTTAAARESRQR